MGSGVFGVLISNAIQSTRSFARNSAWGGRTESQDGDLGPAAGYTRTRELAAQVADSVCSHAQYLPFSATVIYDAVFNELDHPKVTD